MTVANGSDGNQLGGGDVGMTVCVGSGVVVVVVVVVVVASPVVVGPSGVDDAGVVAVVLGGDA